MPSSHNGILYLVHTGNIIQALNGRDGELIWEYRAGPERRRGMRNLAIYERQDFRDDERRAHARARCPYRRAQWETRFADTKQRATAPRPGPSYIKGKLLQGLNGCDRFKEDGCFITAFDAATGKHRVAVQHGRAPRRTGRRYVGQAADDVPRRRRDLDYRQLRSRV